MQGGGYFLIEHGHAASPGTLKPPPRQGQERPGSVCCLCRSCCCYEIGYESTPLFSETAFPNSGRLGPKIQHILFAGGREEDFIDQEESGA